MVIAKGDSACDPPVFSLFGPFLEHKIVIAKGESACDVSLFWLFLDHKMAPCKGEGACEAPFFGSFWTPKWLRVRARARVTLLCWLVLNQEMAP